MHESTKNHKIRVQSLEGNTIISQDTLTIQEHSSDTNDWII